MGCGDHTIPTRLITLAEAIKTRRGGCFTTDQPNELWQADATHWQLADDTEVEILNFLDDHSRVALAESATGELGCEFL